MEPLDASHQLHSQPNTATPTHQTKQDRLTCKPLDLSTTDWYGCRGHVMASLQTTKRLVYCCMAPTKRWWSLRFTGMKLTRRLSPCRKQSFHGSKAFNFVRWRSKMPKLSQQPCSTACPPATSAGSTMKRNTKVQNSAPNWAVKPTLTLGVMPLNTSEKDCLPADQHALD